MPLYDYDKHLASAEQRVTEGDYSERSKALVFRFEKSLFAQGLSKPRVIKYLRQLNAISQWAYNEGFELEDATRDDIENLAGIVARKDVTDWTKHDYLTTIKRFYKWMNNEEEPEITQWITPFVRHPIKLPEEMLTEDEVKRMIQAADHPRDKALIAIFWDSGGRTGELGNLRLKHIVFDQYGAVAVVDGKTGMRRVRLIFSVPYLAAWIDIHPFKDKPDAHLWVGIGRRGRNKPLKYDAIRMIFKRVAKNAGISKDIYNHLLRHSRSTDLAQYLTESQMKEHLGWKQDSKMPAIYVHLSGKQIDDAMLRIHGIVKQEDNKPQLSTVNCPRCKHVNGTVSNFCARCGMALNVQTALDMDQEKSEMLLKLMSLMEGDPELRNLFKEA